jgi:predicted nucleic acid-binding protein
LIVVDSSGWLEVMSMGPNARHFRPVIKRTEEVIVPALVLYEVCKCAFLWQGAEYAKAVAVMLDDGIYVEVSREVVAAAVDVSLRYKLATADSLIYATALEYDATLWTQDKHFKGLPSVKYFDKAA